MFTSEGQSSKDVFRLQDLPIELIAQVYVYSGNALLAHTSRYFYEGLNEEAVRLQFYSQFFNRHHQHPPPNYVHERHDEELSLLHRRLLNAPWFDVKFAERLSAITPELLCSQDSPGDRKSTIYDAKVRHTRLYSASCRGMCLPRSLLRGPWTDEKAVMFHHLRSWRIHPQHADKDYIDIIRDASACASQEGREDIALFLKMDADACSMKWYDDNMGMCFDDDE